MPYVKREKMPTLDELVKFLTKPQINNSALKDLLFRFCRHHVSPSYNNYKNFIGELRQCVAEIERRFKSPSFPRRFDLESSRKISEGRIFELLDAMFYTGIKADGDLNYVLFKFCKYYVVEWKKFCRTLKQCASEIEKKLLAPYEDEKIKENGDV